MRKLIVARILALLEQPNQETFVKSNNGDYTRTGYENMRWSIVAEHIANIMAYTLNKKENKKYLRVFFVDETTLSNLTDEQLLELHELIIRRTYVCM